jgi:hypothetical protein
LKAAVTKRKAILSGKRQIVDGKHILKTPKEQGKKCQEKEDYKDKKG